MEAEEWFAPVVQQCFAAKLRDISLDESDEARNETALHEAAGALITCEDVVDGKPKYIVAKESYVMYRKFEGGSHHPQYTRKNVTREQQLADGFEEDLFKDAGVARVVKVQCIVGNTTGQDD